MNLNPGDPCRVRLHDGRVVEAEYIEPSNIEKCHRVYVDGMNDNFHLLTIKETPMTNGVCRFVGNPCVLEPV